MSKSESADRAREFFVLAEALRAFKAGPLGGHPSDRALAEAAGVSPTTIGDWLRGERFPQDISRVLVVVRMIRDAAARRGIATPGGGPAGLLNDDRWRTAHRQEVQRRAAVVSGVVEHAQAVSALAGPRVRVGAANLRLLGVHEAIRVSGVPDEVPPEYVPRDIDAAEFVDAAEFGLRARVGAAARRGGFVLLVGGSSVGKTRCAAEAVKAMLPDWWLVHPAGPDGVTALALALPPRTVVWLDELQRYLDGEHGLTGSVVRALLTASHPAVLIGTLWPDRYNTYTAVPAPGGADPHARERQVLDLAAVIYVDPDLTPAEQDRACTAAARDRRLAIALEAAGYGLTQTLAAAPQLVARWQNAKTADPYAWAVLTAALDATRLGARAPLSPDLLRAAALGYCTSQQQAEAPGNWFEQALAYVTEKLHGAAAALNPAGTGTGMSQIAGYITADYLLQYASRERLHTRVPASTWDALLSHHRYPADAVRLASSAQGRLLYRYAAALNPHADVGAKYAASQLARRGDLDGLRAWADAGDGYAASQLAELLAERGDLDGLRARADAGDDYAISELVGLLSEREADAGDDHAASRLAGLLSEREDLDGLRARADAGDKAAARRLTELLAERGDLDGLRARADAGDGRAASLLAELLAIRGDHGDLDEAVQIMRGQADAGRGDAASYLALLLAGRGDHGDLDEAMQIMRARADAGDWYAARRLTDLLARRGDLDKAMQIMRARADAGDKAAARQLANLLAERGDLDGLRARADADDGRAASLLAGLLAERGDLDGLRARADAGDWYAASQLAGLLARRGDLEKAMQIMRARADAGDGRAASRMTELLAERGDLDGLRARADAGDWYAASQLAGLLARRGDLDGLRARASVGDDHAASRLAGLLAERGDLDGAVQIMRARADAGKGDAGWLAVLLTQQGRGDEAKQLRSFGLNPDGSTASG